MCPCVAGFFAYILGVGWGSTVNRILRITKCVLLMDVKVDYSNSNCTVIGDKEYNYKNDNPIAEINMH